MATPTPEHDENVGDKKPTGEEEILAGWYRMAGVGIEFVVAIALFAGIGYAIDHAHPFRAITTRPPRPPHVVDGFRAGTAP